MRIAATYSFNGGKESVTNRFPKLLVEITAAIKKVDATQHRTKRSKEKTMAGRMLYRPRSLNGAFKAAFSRHGWQTVRVPCSYSDAFYEADYSPRVQSRRPFREMDFVKNKLGIEVQFGKYAFMVYNVCAKMTIFKNLGYIDTGVEIVPVKSLAKAMSSGVSYFEQIVWDLQQRGVADIDIPVLILGVDV